MNNIYVATGFNKWGISTSNIAADIITDKIIGILPFDTALVDQIPFVDSNMIIESLYKCEDETIFIVNLGSCPVDTLPLSI